MIFLSKDVLQMKSYTNERLSQTEVKKEIDKLKGHIFHENALLRKGKDVCGIRLGKRLVRVYTDTRTQDVRINLSKRKVAKIKLLCEAVGEHNHLVKLINIFSCKVGGLFWSMMIPSPGVRLLKRTVGSYQPFDLSSHMHNQGNMCDFIFDLVLFYDHREKLFFLTGSDIGFGISSDNSIMNIVVDHHSRTDDTVADEKDRFAAAKRPLEALGHIQEPPRPYPMPPQPMWYPPSNMQFLDATPWMTYPMMYPSYQ